MCYVDRRYTYYIFIFVLDVLRAIEVHVLKNASFFSIIEYRTNTADFFARHRNKFNESYLQLDVICKNLYIYIHTTQLCV